MTYLQLLISNRKNSRLCGVQLRKRFGSYGERSPRASGTKEETGEISNKQAEDQGTDELVLASNARTWSGPAA